MLSGTIRIVIMLFYNFLHVVECFLGDDRRKVGLVAGAYLAGKTPVIYMQNSGFFAASNDIASLLIPYEIPIFFVVSYRGCEGEDAVQHLTTGRTTEALIKSLGLPFVVFDQHDLDNLVRLMFQKMHESKLPTVLLLKRGWQR